MLIGNTPCNALSPDQEFALVSASPSCAISTCMCMTFDPVWVGSKFIILCILNAQKEGSPGVRLTGGHHKRKCAAN